MKIEIENLGPITNKAEIDLKPLSVFIGENNTGKTWTAYIIAFIFSGYSYDVYTALFNSGKLKEKYPIIDNSIEEILQKGDTQIDLSIFLDENSNQYINNISKICKHGLKDFFGTDYASFEKLSIKIDISNEIPSFKTTLLNMDYGTSVSPNREGKSKLKFYKKEKDRILHIYSETGDKEKKLPKDIIRQSVYENLFFLIHYSICHNSFIFPSERTGFSTLSVGDYPKDSMGAMTREYNKGQKTRVKHHISMSTGRVLDIMHKYLTIKNQDDHLKKRIENKETRKFVECANLYQNIILHGSLNKSKPTDRKYTELLYKYNNEIELDMTMVSSIVKASSPLIIYLKFFAEKGELIIIDEPEMNLHPKAQAQYAEFLGLLINSGLRIIITTHSTFFVDHFVNLIKAAKKKNKKDVAELFFLKNPDSFIPQKRISVYLFSNGSVKNILNKKGMIDWDTFSIISEQLSNIYFQMDEI